MSVRATVISFLHGQPPVLAVVTMVMVMMMMG